MLKPVKRVKIDTGFLCNIRCRFCYYLDRNTNHPTEYVRWQLKTARRKGIEHIDFSGGESTIRKDFLNLIIYAKKLGFKTICVITNGLKFSDKSYMKDCRDAGLNEILLSVHGYNKETHDKITRAPGSFEKLMKCATNSRELGVPLRTNSTITTINSDPVEHAKLFEKLKPFQVNFILFNDWKFARKLTENLAVDYSKITPKLKEAIDLLESYPFVKHINVRYIPFCFMEGYEKYVCDHRQLRFDPFEWKPSIRDLFENGRKKHLLNLAYCTFRYFPTYLIRTKKLKDIFDEMIICACQNGYSKGIECSNCKYEPICDGLETTYSDIKGFGELIPVKGGKVKDPIFFRRR